MKFDIAQLEGYENDYESWLINKNNIYILRYQNSYVYLFCILYAITVSFLTLKAV